MDSGFGLFSVSELWPRFNPAGLGISYSALVLAHVGVMDHLLKLCPRPEADFIPYSPGPSAKALLSLVRVMS